jgi:hypothetical protein
VPLFQVMGDEELQQLSWAMRLRRRSASLRVEPLYGVSSKARCRYRKEGKRMIAQREKELAGLIVELLMHVVGLPPDDKGRLLIKRARRVVDGLPDAIAAGEANYRAYCAADPDHAPDGTIESLATCAHMLEEYGPDCLPANEHGQVHFARAMMDATATQIRAFLAIEDEAAPELYGVLQRFVEQARVGSGSKPVARSARVNCSAGIFHDAVAALAKYRDSGSGSQSEDAPKSAAEAGGPQSGGTEGGASPKGRQP